MPIVRHARYARDRQLTTRSPLQRLRLFENIHRTENQREDGPICLFPSMTRGVVSKYTRSAFYDAKGSMNVPAATAARRAMARPATPILVWRGGGITNSRGGGTVAGVTGKGWRGSEKQNAWWHAVTTRAPRRTRTDVVRKMRYAPQRKSTIRSLSRCTDVGCTATCHCTTQSWQSL